MCSQSEPTDLTGTFWFPGTMLGVLWSENGLYLLCSLCTSTNGFIATVDPGEDKDRGKAVGIHYIFLVSHPSNQKGRFPILRMSGSCRVPWLLLARPCCSHLRVTWEQHQRAEKRSREKAEEKNPWGIFPTVFQHAEPLLSWLERSLSVHVSYLRILG